MLPMFARTWWVFLLRRLLAVIFGILAIVWPGVTAIVLLYFIAAWAIIIGIFAVLCAIHMRRVIQGEG